MATIEKIPNLFSFSGNDYYRLTISVTDLHKSLHDKIGIPFRSKIVVNPNTMSVLMMLVFNPEDIINGEIPEEACEENLNFTDEFISNVFPMMASNRFVRDHVRHLQLDHLYSPETNLERAFMIYNWKYKLFGCFVEVPKIAIPFMLAYDKISTTANLCYDTVRCLGVTTGEFNDMRLSNDIELRIPTSHVRYLIGISDTNPWVVDGMGWCFNIDTEFVRLLLANHAALADCKAIMSYLTDAFGPEFKVNSKQELQDFMKHGEELANIIVEEFDNGWTNFSDKDGDFSTDLVKFHYEEVEAEELARKREKEAEERRKALEAEAEERRRIAKIEKAFREKGIHDLSDLQKLEDPIDNDSDIDPLERLYQKMMSVLAESEDDVDDET